MSGDFKVASIKELLEEKLGCDLSSPKAIMSAAKKMKLAVKQNWGWGKVLLELFETYIEEDLWEPTFVKDYPYEVSPLSRKKDDNPEFTDRIELLLLVESLPISL